MEWLTAATTFVTEHWVDIGVGMYIADRVVRWTPWVEDDEILGLVRTVVKKLAGRDPMGAVKEGE